MPAVPQSFLATEAAIKHFGFSVGKAFGCGQASHSLQQFQIRKKESAIFLKYAGQVSLEVSVTIAKRMQTANPLSSIRFMTPAPAV